MSHKPPAAEWWVDGSKGKISSPVLSPETEGIGGVSPIRPNRPGTSCFPQLSQFDFGFNNSFPSLVSPTTYNSRAASQHQPLAAGSLSIPSPRRPILMSNEPALITPSLHQSPAIEAAMEEEAPPPYTKFAERTHLNQPVPAHTRSAGSGRRNFFRSSHGMSVLTLDDLRSNRQKREALEAERRSHEARQRRGGMWRGWWFCPAGGCLGFGRGPVHGRRRMTKTRKWCLIASLAVIVLLATIFGAVVGRMKGPTSRGLAGEPESSPELVGLPTIPLGSVVVRPFRGVQLLTTCAGAPYQWSCALPPDTKFPITAATNDGLRVPEFRFTIKRRMDNTVRPDSTWTPVPRNVPNITDYERLSQVDGAKNAGEETGLYITLATSGSSSSQDIKAKETLNDPPGIVVREDQTSMVRPESHMLPLVLKNQPLRLFDRGLDTEHYGFHIYFDKTVQFANNTRLASNRDTGGVSAENSHYRIQWSNTRFKVAIFTKSIGKVVKTTAVTELDLPADIWEDRAGGIEEGKVITALPLDKNGVPGKPIGIVEKSGVNTGKRGCFCHWSNYHQDDGIA